MLRVGSTFSGVGGADLGLERAGFSVEWLCEWDAWKQSVLAAHWPGVDIYGDIRDVTEPAPVDLLCGGFPCQDLSVAGKRRGFGGERSVLAFEFLRIAESLRPRWLLMENVPGLLSSNGGRDLARLLDEVGACGYGWAFRILDARYFGVPQRRRRVFIVARRADAELDSRAASELALRALWEGSDGDPTPGWPPREITAARFGQSSSRSREVSGVMGNVAHSLCRTASKMVSEDGTGRGCPVIAFGHTQGIDPQTSAKATPTLRKGGGGAGVAIPKVVNTLDRQAGGPDDNSAQAGHLIPGVMSVRRLTPVECERLMGWPDNWTAPEGVKAPDSKRYAACGDGIVSWCAYWVGSRIKMIEDEA